LLKGPGVFKNLPLKTPKPNGSEFVDLLLHSRPGRRVPLIEYIIDDVLLKPIVSDVLGRTWVPMGDDRASQKAYLDNFIKVWYHLGYDFVRFETGMRFQPAALYANDVGPDASRIRQWDEQHHGAITSWKDFETFAWPEVKDVDFFLMEYLDAHLPEGMGLITCHGAGIFEHVSKVFSYEGLCFALMDAPDLVQAVTEQVGLRLEQYYRQLVQLERVQVLFQGDDMGFRSGTLISPNDLRKYFLPWHKRFAAIAHEHGHPYFLHSCGQVLPIMNDLVDDVKIDGKHSFEDAIVPVEEFQKLYGDRIAVLGGLDINILSAGSVEQVRAKTRALIDTCGSRGRYAIGSGNSVPSYVPVANYLTMIDEALA
jgi:uroporphyrinogen decarboxylase